MALWNRFFTRLRAYLGEPLEKSLRRRLRAAAPAEIGELREGLHCRIAGEVRALEGRTLEAPLSGLPCVAYLLEVVERIGTNVGEETDLAIYDRQAVPFLLVEGTHNAVIDPTHSQVLVGIDHEVIARSPLELSPRVRALLTRYLPNRRWEQTTRIRFHERVIELGERVSIAGTGHREADPHAAGERMFRDKAQERLRFVGTTKLPLLIGSDPP